MKHHMAFWKACASIVFCLTQLGACSPAPFQSPQVACQDMASRKLVEQVDTIHREGRDAYVLDHFDTMLPLYKKLANQGNVEAMAYYGRFQLLALILPHTFSTQESVDTKVIFNVQDEASRSKAVDALSYLYIFSMQKTNRNESDLELVSSLDSGKIKHIIPPAWIAEAKGTATRWKARCEKN